MLRRLAVALVLLLSLSNTARAAAAELHIDIEPKTAPVPMPLPATGEPGVWIPVWLQQEFLKTDAALGSCDDVRLNQTLQLSEQALALHETRAASAALKESVEALKLQLAVARVQEQDAAERAQRNLYIAIGSTGAAVVAISILLLEHL